MIDSDDPETPVSEVEVIAWTRCCCRECCETCRAWCPCEDHHKECCEDHHRDAVRNATKNTGRDATSRNAATNIVRNTITRNTITTEGTRETGTKTRSELSRGSGTMIAGAPHTRLGPGVPEPLRNLERDRQPHQLTR